MKRSKTNPKKTQSEDKSKPCIKIKRSRKSKNMVERLKSCTSTLSFNNQDEHFIEKCKKHEEIDFLKRMTNNYNIDKNTMKCDIVKTLQRSIHMMQRIEFVKKLYEKVKACFSEQLDKEQDFNCFDMCQKIERSIYYYYSIDPSYKVFYVQTMSQIIDYFSYNGKHMIDTMSFEEIIFFLANSSYFIKNTEKYEKHMIMLKDVEKCKSSINIEKNDPFEDCKKIIKCRYCGHNKVKISMIQERRSDEGSTIIYQCTKDHTHMWRQRG